MNDCVFCDATKIKTEDMEMWSAQLHGFKYDVMVFTPLNPVTPGHLLVVPVRHCADAGHDSDLALAAMYVASDLVRKMDSANIITSKGEAATQTVGHLHLHVVPRYEGDGLHLPWTQQKKSGDCLQCGAPFIPIRRGECLHCGSDAGAVK